MTKKTGPKTPAYDFLLGPVTGHVLQMMRDRHGFLERAMLQQGDFVHYRYFRQNGYLVLDPEGIKQVLHTRQAKYSKLSRGNKFLSQIVGRGLLTSETNEFWQQGRRVIQPFFIRKQYPRYVHLMRDCALNMVKRWRDPKFQGRPFDLTPEMTKFTLNVLGRSIFNEDFDEHSDLVYVELRRLLDITEDRILHIVPRIGRTKKAQEAEFGEATGRLNALVDGLIQKSKAAATKDPENNLIHALLASPANFSDVDLRDQVLTLMLAGHETTATALCWLFILLELHPLQKSKVVTEVRALDIGVGFSEEKVRELHHTQMVIQETLRMYPPFWVMGRVAAEDDTLLGHAIKAGDRIQINPYFTHHNPRYWDAPEEFRPGRFSPENISKINEYCYLPFGKGPRTCIGNTFAMFEMLIGVAVFFQHFDVTVENAMMVRPDFRMSLRPDQEVQVTLQKSDRTEQE